MLLPHICSTYTFHHIFFFYISHKHSWSFYMKFMKRVSYISYEMTTSVRFCLPYDRFRLDFIVVMTLHVRAKMLCNVWP